MKITKLPNAIDPNKIMQEEIDRRNSTCPFCGEVEKYDLRKYISRVTIAMIKTNDNHITFDKGIERQFNTKSWYGNQYEYKHPFLGSFAFWKPQYHWRIDSYKCHTCGAEWESDPYPKIEI